jgi:CDP-paratose 2-epimerase
MKIAHDLLGDPAGAAADQRPVLVTGGAGFIGTNVAHRFLRRRRPVILFDNLSRPGVERNIEWLRRMHGDLVQLDESDIRDAAAVRRAVKRCSQVLHFAAQVAVTESLVDPTFDFEVNARGTLNLLEALRSLETPPPLIFTSSNKVYGDLNDVGMRCRDSRYEPLSPQVRKWGFSEARPLQFHSPYGCSKGAAGQYVLDYARTFGLSAVVFHMSCIYGPHQFGNEDQGWVAHFLIRALEGAPITIYGDGRQLRDVLFVEDLADALLLAQEKIAQISGQSFNIGGGPENTISLLELLDLIVELNGSKPPIRFEEWRAADQRYYVSDIRKFSEATGWKPRISVQDGVSRLFQWLTQDRADFAARSRQPRNKRAWQRNGHSSRELIAN